MPTSLRRLLPVRRGHGAMLRFAPLAVAAAIVGLALITGVGLLLRPSPDVGPSPLPGPSGDPTPLPSPLGNGWIAVSTLPAAGQTSNAFRKGGDIWLVREGAERTLIADRGETFVKNVCPTFSPDGRLLAYGEATETDRAIVVLGVDGGGVTEQAPLRLSVPGAGDAPCPRWSSDGSRVAYLADDAGTIVVRGLDGSSRPRADGDPSRVDFAWDGERSLISPDGELVLHMVDDSATSFRMYTIPNGSTGIRIHLTHGVAVNNSRSWPGRSDLSWQPLFP
jgi:dipeptidyl aminopeptidase/acylaminoacyl peptidase